MLFRSAVLLVVLGGCACTRRLPLLLPPPQGENLPPLPPDQWFTQKLDHLQPSDNRTWQQRYQMNDTFYRPGGPVFLMIGGEGPASAIWLVTGQWLQYAQQHGALCFQLEHRFYGKSHPTEDMSVENLRYLSSEQALADLAEFTVAMTTEHNLSSDTRWVAFGGSYPGSLAAWYRLKYPHLVHAAVSTSAPLLAKTNFLEYMEVVTDSVTTKAGVDCYDDIAAAFGELEDFLTDQTKWVELSAKFQLCSVYNGSTSQNVSTLVSSLADLFEGTIQYNEDNRGFEGAKDANITINTLCDVMNKDGNAPLDRLAAVNRQLMAAHNELCLDASYDSMIAAMRDTGFNSPSNSGARQWIYQTCTEFGWYQTSDFSHQPFGHHMPLSFSVQQCLDTYGPAFDEEFINLSVSATNARYGALDIQATRVVFVNGGIDPWHAMGLTETLSADRPAVFVNETAHCANMYPARAEDAPSLVAAREKIGDYITAWLAE